MAFVLHGCPSTSQRGRPSIYCQVCAVISGRASRLRLHQSLTLMPDHSISRLSRTADIAVEEIRLLPDRIGNRRRTAGCTRCTWTLESLAGAWIWIKPSQSCVWIVSQLLPIQSHAICRRHCSTPDALSLRSSFCIPAVGFSLGPLCVTVLISSFGQASHTSISRARTV